MNPIESVKEPTVSFPKYLDEKIFETDKLKNRGFKIAQAVLEFFVRLILNLRKDRDGNIDKEAVEKVYQREARKYNTTHHLTTRGQDLMWRRQAGFFVLNYLLENRERGVKVLDLCTGTGLTIVEICKVLKAYGLDNRQLEIIGLDYTLEMLDEAKKYDFSHFCPVTFVHGDVMSLVQKKEGMTCFEPNSIDLITQMFGIGGVEDPLKSFYEVLKVLKTRGQYYLIDMHKPVKDLPGEWFFLGKWIAMPYFEERTYYDITRPMVLNNKWGWQRETSDLYYLLRLIVIHDEQSDKYFGFRTSLFEMEPQRWWFSLPIMPVARIIVEKNQITKEEADRRKNTLDRFLYN